MIRIKLCFVTILKRNLILVVTNVTSVYIQITSLNNNLKIKFIEASK